MSYRNVEVGSFEWALRTLSNAPSEKCKLTTVNWKNKNYDWYLYRSANDLFLYSEGNKILVNNSSQLNNYTYEEWIEYEPKVMLSDLKPGDKFTYFGDMIYTMLKNNNRIAPNHIFVYIDSHNHLCASNSDSIIEKV